MGDLNTGVAKLSLNPSMANSTKKKKPTPVADSWEDEDVSSGSDTEGPAAGEDDSGKNMAKEGTTAPPPTPISAEYASRPFPPTGAPVPGSPAYGNFDGQRADRARPEKTDAVARRMIASALGVKVPKQTEEQRAYDKAVREKERKRREEEKVREKQKEEEAAQARAAVWDD